MTVITKSYAPDFALCVQLHHSVLSHTQDSVRHQIIVPQRDLKLFSKLSGPRAEIRCDSEFLPRFFIPLPFGNTVVNVRQPFPPVRGWILQQIVKLAAVAACQDNVALVVDSDIEFIRHFDADLFTDRGVVRFYRKHLAISQQMRRHVAWQQVARELLGLGQVQPPYTDYISAMLACDPHIVRRMLNRVEQTTKMAWPTAIASQLHFSEWTLYGVYVDEALGAPANSFHSDDPRCFAYWGTEPLDQKSAVEFLGGIAPTDIAAMISAKSRTPLDVRRAAFAEYHAAQRFQGGE